ncbi:MAG: Ribonuclease P protein component [candidate division WS6 bacterium GW2011_GWA2_37_6]|uniref:Ribonuclease P protein component n=1 Tax=candidate division WS6 bacterium GW2011_GWA2_37_6 TaxID=1619087 RepID=A0A0G0GTG2_9BACT|nr:MAG: Ribonuclease P protein component [candidate division WS6 bacterium GW2011_GWA2_37_6]
MLPKKNRLKTKKDFDTVYKNGRSLKTPYFNFIYLKNRKQEDIPRGFLLPRFGFVASKKVGKAVKRNKAKKLLREVVRAELPSLLKNFEAVFIAYDTMPMTDFVIVQKTVKSVFQKAELYFLV